FEGLAGAAAVLIDYLSVLDAEHFPAFPTRRSSDLDGDVVAAAPVDRAAVVERAAVDESRAGAGEIERAAAADIQRTSARESGVGAPVDDPGCGGGDRAGDVQRAAGQGQEIAGVDGGDDGVWCVAEVEIAAAGERRAGA